MKIAVIGLGYWGPNIIKTLKMIGDISIIGCESDGEQLERIKKKFPGIEYYSNYKRLLGDENVDAVIISTPVDSHYRIGKDFLKDDKNILVEKPLTVSSSQVEELIEISSNRNLVLMVGHICEYTNGVIKIGELIKDGEIGNIQYITSTRLNLGIHRKDVNVLWDLATHDLSIIYNWFDTEPVTVSTTGKSSAVKDLYDSAFLQIEFSNGIISDIRVSWVAPLKEREFLIVGDKKMILYDETEPSEKIKIFKSGIKVKENSDISKFTVSYYSGKVKTPELSPYQPLTLEIKHFIECCKNRTTPKTDGYSALKVIKTLEMAEKSLTEKRIITADDM